MQVLLTVTRFKTIFIPFAFMGMALLHLPLWLNRQITFYKLLGAGGDAQPDLPADYRHWGLLTCWANEKAMQRFQVSSFVAFWFRLFAAEQFSVVLQPVASHGLWDGKQPFVSAPLPASGDARVAVLTRATIRPGKMKAFRSDIRKASAAMRTAPGFILAAGLGENPFFRQATFSIWENTELMKNYAYKHHDHAAVIKRTRAEQWYSEELFARFRVVAVKGTLNGRNYSI
ncbi:DUF3291 domain-containing protein [Pedobacter yulinensis]|uniref:DUF3291 domain-containing protein n=1 Tax=Pedobacter yulinensis TaxID=2126353 RepID=A0A2T3HL65_9SPHI|nr:DUF3291 domain-containing protein [Pedobacter yulinensis]PST83208.1 DUF3291 domain-containing protein [Pedobacter yulinensis]